MAKVVDGDTTSHCKSAGSRTFYLLSSRLLKTWKLLRTVHTSLCNFLTVPSDVLQMQSCACSCWLGQSSLKFERRGLIWIASQFILSLGRYGLPAPLPPWHLAESACFCPNHDFWTFCFRLWGNNIVVEGGEIAPTTLAQHSSMPRFGPSRRFKWCWIALLKIWSISFHSCILEFANSKALTSPGFGDGLFAVGGQLQPQQSSTSSWNCGDPQVSCKAALRTWFLFLKIIVSSFMPHKRNPAHALSPFSMVRGSNPRRHIALGIQSSWRHNALAPLWPPAPHCLRWSRIELSKRSRRQRGLINHWSMSR